MIKSKRQNNIKLTTNDRDDGGGTAYAASQTGKREREWHAAYTPLSARSTALFTTLLILLMLYKRPGTSALTKCYDTNTGRRESLI